MKLFILRPITELDNDPWDPWYDKAFGFVIRANDEEEARKIADSNAGDENERYITIKNNHPWLDEKYSTCNELTTDGESELIITDFRRA